MNRIDCLQVMYLVSFVDQTFVVDLLEDPPNGLHECWVHGAIVFVKINPAGKSGHDLLVKC